MFYNYNAKLLNCVAVAYRCFQKTCKCIAAFLITSVAACFYLFFQVNDGALFYLGHPVQKPCRNRSVLGQ